MYLLDRETTLNLFTGKGERRDGGQFNHDFHGASKFMT